jgi:hypothetical protein
MRSDGNISSDAKSVILVTVARLFIRSFCSSFREDCRVASSTVFRFEARLSPLRLSLDGVTLKNGLKHCDMLPT